MRDGCLRGALSMPANSRQLEVLAAFVDVVAGVWLWQGRRRGAALGLAMTPLALALAGGFALPFLIAPVPIRVGLVLAGRRSLR